MIRFALLALLATAPFAVAAESGAAPAREPAIPVVKTESIGITASKAIPSIIEQTKDKPAALTLKAFSQALDSKLPGVLAQTRKFKVVTRAELETVLAEQNLASSGNLDAEDPQLAKRFKLAGAATLLVVTIDEFQDRDEVRTFESSGETVRRRLIHIGASAKLIDATTGVVTESVTVPRVTQEDLRDTLAALTSVEERANAYPAGLAGIVAERIAMRIIDVRFPAKIVMKGIDKDITINRGDGTGILVGQEWGVFATGEEMRDPDTGETLGRHETLIGKVVVTSVEPKVAKARILMDQGIQTGAILRLLPPPVRVTPPEPASK